jgi:hypothetical protein
MKDPLKIRLKSRLGPLLDVPLINAMRGVPLPDVTGEAAQGAIARMIVEGGRLIARVGETEGRAAAWFLTHRLGERGEAPPYEPLNRERLKTLAGYFPTSDDAIDRLARRYVADMSRIDLYAAWTPHDRLLCPRGVLKCRLIDLDPFFAKRPWPLALAGKRVTIVSPFKNTITRQWALRDKLFSKPLVPECDLKVVQTPQTQCEEDIRGQDWFDNLARVDANIASTAPEAVIIGAGAYGLPVGAAAARRGASVVVMGGSTQLLFGIMGNRWLPDPRYAALQNEYWTRPGVEERPPGFQKFETAGGAYW